MENWEKKTSSEAGLGSEGRSWALLPLSLTQGILGVERHSTVANGKGWEKKSVNCSVAETKLTLTSLEGWIGVSWALLADPYLRSPASRVIRDFPMQLHPALYCTMLYIHIQKTVQIYGSGEADRGFFNWALELVYFYFLELHSCSGSSLWWSLRTKKWRGGGPRLPTWCW